MRTFLQRLVLPAVTVGLVAAGLSASSPAQAVTGLGQQGCPNGQVVGGANLVKDSDFSRAASGDITFETQLPNRGPGVWPSDGPQFEGGPGGGGFSIQTGSVRYNFDLIEGRAFPGDPSREVPPSTTYFYSNPNITLDSRPFYDNVDGGGFLWRQTVPVTGNTTYNFYAYFDNLLIPTTGGFDPVIDLRVDDPDDGLPPISAGQPITVTKSPDAWVPVQYTFTTGPNQTQAILEIWDVTGKGLEPPQDATKGADFGMVGINLRQCAAALGVAKAVAPPVRNSDGSYNITYTITVQNYGSGLEPVANLQVTDVLTATFANAGSFQVVSLSSSPNVTVNPSFTGRVPNAGLLTGTNSLPPNQTATISLTVRVTVGPGLGGRGPFPNRAFVTANSNGVVVEDDSVPGTVPDLGNDNNPKDPGDDGDTIVNIGARLALPLVRR